MQDAIRFSCAFVRTILFGVVVACLVAGSAAAAPAATPGGRIVLSLPSGAAGPLVLTAGQGGFVGEFTIHNAGSEPLTVSRIALRGDEDDARSPSRLSVRFAEGAATSANLLKGASRNVVVSWMPDRDPRVRQAFGHVVVTSTDELAGEVAMGFRAQVPTGLSYVGEHALSILVLSPLLAVFVVALARLAGCRSKSLARRASLAAAVFELLVALWVYRHFVPDVGRVDGNDGYQLVERFLWVPSLGTEWYVGVDGASLSLVLLAAAVSLVALTVGSAEPRSDAYYAAFGLLSAGVMGVLVSLDLVLFFGAWQSLWIALVLLVGGWGGRRNHAAAAKLSAYAAVGSVALLLSFVSLSRSSGAAFLVDGTAVAHTTSIPELARTSFAASSLLFGVSAANVAWGLLLVAIAIASPIVPLHGWLPDILEQGPPGAALVTGGVVTALGPYLLMRVGLGAVPEGARWAGASVVALGAVGAAWGALCAMAQTDLRRFVAYAAVSSAGLSLYGLGALTPEGIAGGGLSLFAHGLSTTLLLAVAAAVEHRVQTTDVPRLGGITANAPFLATLAAVGLAVSVGVPGLAGSWGVLLAFLGGFVRYPVLALVVAGALVVSTAAHLRVVRALLLGPKNPDWEKSTTLAPFDGKLPDATWPEMLVLFPLAAIALLVGVWPAPILSSVFVSARDSSAGVDPTGPDSRVERVEPMRR